MPALRSAATSAALVQRLAVDQRAVHVPEDRFRRHGEFLLLLIIKRLRRGDKPLEPALILRISPLKTAWCLRSALRAIARRTRQLRTDVIPCKQSVRCVLGGMGGRREFAGRTAAANRLDDAARAGWLYYVAGNTQDQIAAKARRLAADRAAAGVACRVGRPDQGPGRPPDRQLPRPGRPAEIALRARSGRGRAERPGLPPRPRWALPRLPPPKSRGGCARRRRSSWRSAPGERSRPRSSSCRRWNARSTRWCR